MTQSSVVLALNSGSSSLKFAVYPAGAEQPILKGKAERIGLESSLFEASDNRGGEVANDQRPLPDHEAALRVVLACVRDNVPIPLRAVGHRVVRGGVQDTGPRLVTPGLLSRMKDLVPYLPAHLPHQIRAIEAVQKHEPALAQVACFDTAFHRAMPRIAQLYALPRSLTESGILRYGFHGLSYEFVISELARQAGEQAARGRVVIAHLGNGCSMAAVRNLCPVDTTMGFSPASGLVMSSRSGDLDPEVVLYLIERRNMSPGAVGDLLNRQSGLAGVSGGSSDMRDLLAREAADPQAAEAIALFCYQAKKHLGALAAALGGLDVLIFTAGIGENAPEIRRRICEGMDHLGLLLDPRVNERNEPGISMPGSPASIRVIPTNEELMIARHTVAVIGEETQAGHVRPLT